MSQNNPQSTTDAADAPNDVPTDEPVDMTESDDEAVTPAERRQRANEIYDRLAEGRGQSSTVVLETPYGEITCDVDLSNLDLSTRWDCISALPDGIFRAAQRQEEDGAAEIELSSSVVPDGEGVTMIKLIVLNTLDPRGYSDGDWQSMVENDLRDEVLIKVGLGLLEMSFDRGEITGFRFE